MKILLNNNDLIRALYGTMNLGFVPTMGSLHQGHISLIKRSLKVCNKTIVSIFINPTQFNNNKDYKNYPRNTSKDLFILKKLKVDFVYLPKKKDVYNYFERKIILHKKDRILCAKFRKGHFEGVIDVMKRLTKKINPNKIFLGEKDFQQLYLIKKYFKKKNLSIIGCKTIRDRNKLALSSRNTLLNKTKLKYARSIAKNLILFKKKIINKKKLKSLLENKKKELIKSYNIKIDYLELRDKKNLAISDKTKNSKIFIAYYLNSVRLIDNY